MRTALIATVIGIVVTLLLLALAFALDALGLEKVPHIVFWQNSLLQSLCPAPNIETPEHPVYEGTPLNFIAFIASIPLGFLVYGAAAYFILRSRRGGT